VEDRCATIYSALSYAVCVIYMIASKLAIALAVSEIKSPTWEVTKLTRIFRFRFFQQSPKNNEVLSSIREQLACWLLRGMTVSSSLP
jgi:hypothetical protein